MNFLEYDVAAGVDALCTLLPNLSKHAESRPLRDGTLRFAAQLASGEIKGVMLEFLSDGPNKNIVVIADSPADRAQFIESWKAKQQSQHNATVLQFPTPDRV